MFYCLNPACVCPVNSIDDKYCQGCGEDLAISTKSYLFRVHYRIIQCLGQGSFGRTYLAEDTDFMDEPRVIKKLIISISGSTEGKIRELFLREAKQLYRINHPQIPKLYAYFEQDNALYLVQEFIEGDDLFKEVSQSGKFSEQKIKSLLQDLLPVLDYLHSNKIIHRDIKPENIMRCRKTGKLILIDFGGSKQISTILLSRPGTILYTPGYAAVEHMMGQPSAASDIYSLGATCVRLLTGYFSSIDKFGNIQDELYDKNSLQWRWREYLHNQGETINEELGKILDKMLAIIADNRYQSAREILAILNPQQSKTFSNILNTSNTETQVERETSAPLDPVFIERCQRELTRYIGPIASYILEDTLAQYPRIVPQKLVEILSNEIANPQNAKQFKEHLL